MYVHVYGPTIPDHMQFGRIKGSPKKRVTNGSRVLWARAFWVMPLGTSPLSTGGGGGRRTEKSLPNEEKNDKDQ